MRTRSETEARGNLALGNGTTYFFRISCSHNWSRKKKEKPGNDIEHGISMQSAQFPDIFVPKRGKPDAKYNVSM